MSNRAKWLPRLSYVYLVLRFRILWELPMESPDIQIIILFNFHLDWTTITLVTHNYPGSHSTFVSHLLSQLRLRFHLREPNIPSDMQWVLDICSSVVSRSWERRAPPSEIPNMNTLAGLPVELLISITDFLPLKYRIYTLLCSRRLFVVFNHRSVTPFPQG